MNAILRPKKEYEGEPNDSKLEIQNEKYQNEKNELIDYTFQVKLF